MATEATSLAARGQCCSRRDSAEESKQIAPLRWHLYLFQRPYRRALGAERIFKGYVLRGVQVPERDGLHTLTVNFHGKQLLNTSFQNVLRASA